MVFSFFVQPSMFISASIDGVFFPKSPEQLLSENAINAVPYIIGVNNCEFGYLMPMVRLTYGKIMLLFIYCFVNIGLFY